MSYLLMVGGMPFGGGGGGVGSGLINENWLFGGVLTLFYLVLGCRIVLLL